MDSEIEVLHTSEDDLRQGGGFQYLHSLPETYHIHTHNFFEVFLIPKGTAIHNINGTAQLLTEGSFVIMRPPDIHRYEFFNNYDFGLINLELPAGLMEAALTFLQVPLKSIAAQKFPPHLVLTAAVLWDVKRKLLHIDTIESLQQRYLYIRSIVPYLLQIFFSQQETDQKPAAVPGWFTALLDDFSRAENFTAGLPRLLALGARSQEYLNRAFRKYIGSTPTEFINMKRMNLAADLLLSSERQIIDISAECGFNNLSHFYRVFHKQFGCPPKQFLASYTRQDMQKSSAANSQRHVNIVE